MESKIFIAGQAEEGFPFGTTRWLEGKEEEWRPIRFSQENVVEILGRCAHKAPTLGYTDTFAAILSLARRSLVTLLSYWEEPLDKGAPRYEGEDYQIVPSSREGDIVELWAPLMIVPSGGDGTVVGVVRLRVDPCLDFRKFRNTLKRETKGQFLYYDFALPLGGLAGSADTEDVGAVEKALKRASRTPKE